MMNEALYYNSVSILYTLLQNTQPFGNMQNITSSAEGEKKNLRVNNKPQKCPLCILVYGVTHCFEEIRVSTQALGKKNGLNTHTHLRAT